MRSQLFAAIDGGGTKTVVVVVNTNGSEVLRRQSATSNAAVIGHDNAGAVLQSLVGSAMKELGSGAALDAVWFGLAGGDRPDDHRKLLPFLRDMAGTVRMSNDAELVLGALPGAVGVALVSGTGSIAFGLDSIGTRARAGGWGHVFGDEGSGYDLACRMLDAYAREIDGRGPATSLTGRLTEHWSLPEPYSLIGHIYAPGVGKGEIAALGRFVIEEAGAGDRVACEILDQAAADLAGMAAAVAKRLGFVGLLPLALTGSLLVRVDPIRERLVTSLTREWPGLSPVMVDDPALMAAQSLARSHREGERS